MNAVCDKVIVHILRKRHGAVMPAGASDRDDELAFALLNVERQHVIDHVRKAGFKALGFLAVHT